MVPGVRVHGQHVVDVEVKLDEQFRPVPVPNEAGIPLLYKKMPGTGGDDTGIRNNVIVRFMSEAESGFAPMEWQYGGPRGPAPPVVLARKDERPFSLQDWKVMEDFMSLWFEEMSELDENRAVQSLEFLRPPSLQNFVRNHPSITGFLDLRFPAGSIVAAEGLSAPELNGEGEVVRYTRDRVGVQFPGRADPVAIKPERLHLVRECPLPTKQDLKQDPDQKVKRQKHLDRQEATVICERFLECLHQDTFPEMGEIHLFGVGSEYHSRAQDVLGVWQGAAKNLDLTSEALIEAMLAGTMKELFEKLCFQLAETRAPNAPYATKLIENRFAAVEWDSLL